MMKVNIEPFIESAKRNQPLVLMGNGQILGEFHVEGFQTHESRLGDESTTVSIQITGVVDRTSGQISHDHKMITAQREQFPTPFTALPVKPCECKHCKGGE